MGTEKMFAFDSVFSSDSNQTEIYKSCIENLLNGCFEGYNASILAYGQTGSGKTYTMGSNNWTNVNEQELGIIPRVIRDIFLEIDKKKEKVEFVIKASFLEIYNEEIVDLLYRKNKLIFYLSFLFYHFNLAKIFLTQRKIQQVKSLFERKKMDQLVYMDLLRKR